MKLSMIIFPLSIVLDEYIGRVIVFFNSGESTNSFHEISLVPNVLELTELDIIEN